MRLRSHLIALVLAVLLPMIAFSVLAIVMLDRYQRANTERSAVELARALMSAVDEALRSAITTLEALAIVRSLEDEDLRAFDREVRRVLTTQTDWQDLILLPRRPSGRPQGRRRAGADAARPAADAKEIRIQSVLDPRADPVSGDPDRLQQVVRNLVLNAVKFAPDVLPFVFDRFRQADSSSRRAHTGLASASRWSSIWSSSMAAACARTARAKAAERRSS